MDSIVFTPAALLDLLTQIDELKDVYVGLSETIDGDIQLQVGESIYHLDTDEAVDLVVDDSVVETLEDINLETYQDLEDGGEIDLSTGDDINSGFLKEVAKTLLVGGMARLAGHMLKN